MDKNSGLRTIELTFENNSSIILTENLPCTPNQISYFLQDNPEGITFSDGIDISFTMGENVIHFDLGPEDFDLSQGTDLLRSSGSRPLNCRFQGSGYLSFRLNNGCRSGYPIELGPQSDGYRILPEELTISDSDVLYNGVDPGTYEVLFGVVECRDNCTDICQSPKFIKYEYVPGDDKDNPCIGGTLTIIVEQKSGCQSDLETTPISVTPSMVAAQLAADPSNAPCDENIICLFNYNRIRAEIGADLMDLDIGMIGHQVCIEDDPTDPDDPIPCNGIIPCPDPELPECCNNFCAECCEDGHCDGMLCHPTLKKCVECITGMNGECPPEFVCNDVGECEPNCTNTGIELTCYADIGNDGDCEIVIYEQDYETCTFEFIRSSKLGFGPFDITCPNIVGIPSYVECYQACNFDYCTYNACPGYDMVLVQYCISSSAIGTVVSEFMDGYSPCSQDVRNKIFEVGACDFVGLLPDKEDDVTKSLNMNSENKNLSESITHFPNPFTQDITIRIQADESHDLNILITDMIGRKVHEQNITTTNGTNDIVIKDMKDMPHGVYMVRVTEPGYLGEHEDNPLEKNFKIIKTR